MKQFVLFLASLVLFTQVQAQKSKKKKKEATVEVEAPRLKNNIDSFSYAVGISIAGFYKAQEVDSIDINSVLLALQDSKIDSVKFTEDEANSILINYINGIKAEKFKAYKEKGLAFLEQNKSNPNIRVTPSGLQYEIIRAGNGEIPTKDDRVKVHYIGTLVDGKEFDNSFKRGQPIDFRVTGVIKGWTEALLMMPVGSKWKVYIPSELGYGDQQAGPDILPGSVLIFEIDLLEIVK